MAEAGPSVVKSPPGVVLGPDGKPCKVCTGFKAWTAAQSKRTPSTPLAAFNTAVAAVSTTPAAEDALPRDCPADVDRLGRHTWTLLHTTAAYYPARPTADQQGAMSRFLAALPALYPCTHCASDLDRDLKREPPDVTSREALQQWMCVLHNGVNRKLGKPEFDCTTLDQRWRDGWQDGHCG